MYVRTSFSYGRVVMQPIFSSVSSELNHFYFFVLMLNFNLINEGETTLPSHLTRKSTSSRQEFCWKWRAEPDTVAVNWSRRLPTDPPPRATFLGTNRHDLSVVH